MLVASRPCPGQPSRPPLERSFWPLTDAQRALLVKVAFSVARATYSKLTEPRSRSPERADREHHAPELAEPDARPLRPRPRTEHDLVAVLEPRAALALRTGADVDLERLLAALCELEEAPLSALAMVRDGARAEEVARLEARAGEGLVGDELGERPVRGAEVGRADEVRGRGVRGGCAAGRGCVSDGA